MSNQFLDEMNKTAETWNGAKSYASSLSCLVDQFGHAGAYRGRGINEVYVDQDSLWNENPLMAIRFPFYLRMVTRKTNYGNEEETDSIQKGMGAKDEAIKRYLWIAKYHNDIFAKYLWLIPVVGSWKDLWTLLYYDRELKQNAIDSSIIFETIANGLRDGNALVKKYLPRIRSSKSCNTPRAKSDNHFAKEFCYMCNITPKQYRNIKTSGNAHDFQKLICSGKYSEIEWNKIPGKALSSLIGGKFLTNHNLVDRYTDFVKSQPTIKFTGYPYELLCNLRKSMNMSTFDCSCISNQISVPPYIKYTFDKQFETLINNARDKGGIKENVMVCVDTSGSMAENIAPNVECLDVSISLGLYFSALNTGEFKDTLMQFASVPKFLKLTGTFTERVNKMRNSDLFGNCGGSTNFQGVVDTIIDTRKRHPEIPLSDYPSTLLMISDMQFNTPKYGWLYENSDKTNNEEMMDKLRSVFPDSFVDSMKFIWWQVNGNAKDVPATLNDKGNILISGFDGSIISNILGEEEKEIQKHETLMEDVVKNALSQEILSLINL